MTKFPQYAAFDAARRQVDQEMAGFLQRALDTTRSRAESKAAAHAGEAKGVQPSKARTPKR